MRNNQNPIELDLADKIGHKLLNGLFRQHLVVLAGNILLAAINLALLWDQLGHTFLIAWSILLLSVLAFRTLLIETYHRHSQKFSAAIWHNLYIGSVLAQGLSWCVLALTAYSHLDFPGLTVLIITLAGITAGAVGSNSSSINSFLALSIPALLPIGLALLIQDDVKVRIVGLLLYIFFVLTLQQVRTIHALLLESINNNIELKQSKVRAEGLAAELYRISTIDALTKIANRRAFDEALSREWRRAIRSNTPMSLLMIDVDYFKNFNDSLGHQAGDDCLLKIATELNLHAKRSLDVAARYGGEEFAIILPDTGKAEAMKFAGLVCRDIEKLGIQHPSSSISNVVTISIGVHSVTPDRKAEVSEFIKHADDALYVAKSEGRNQVTGNT